MGAINRVIGALGPNRSLAERVAVFAAAASVGPSFEPGLQPRKTVDQAIATGVISATTLSLVTATQSAIDSLGTFLLRTRTFGEGGPSTSTRLAFTIGTNLVWAGATEGMARALPAREDEKLRRGLARVAAQRSSRVALAGAGLSAVIGALDVLAERKRAWRWVNEVPLALPAGIAASAFEIQRVHRSAAKHQDTTIAAVSTRTSVLIALGVGAGVIALQVGERQLAAQVARGLTRFAPDYDEVANPIGHLVALGILGGVLGGGYEYATRRVEQGGAAVEPAYESPPVSAFVSGSPDSLVPFSTLSREGRRFTNMVLTREEIAGVMGEPATHDPIRLFVGLDTSDVIEERVELLLDELVRTNAFDRDVLVFASPTGSGYINYVMAEALEYLTLGNSAICTMQYSMLPSSMSLTRTGLAVEQNRAVMYGITGYLRGLAPEQRPKFVLFGESLGALTMQDIWRHRTVEAMDRDFVHSSIFLGTPSATEFAKSWRIDPAKIDPEGLMLEIDNYGEYLDLPDEQRARVRHLLLSHYDDPIPKFGTNLLLRCPWWLGPPEQRPTGVPKSSHWRPGTSFVLTGVDLINAMDVVPGTFGRRGHDYREDIARFVSAIYDLPCTPEQLASIEGALRERELQWAQRRVVTEQVARAKEALLREMKSWGTAEDPSAVSDEVWKELVASAQQDIAADQPGSGSKA
ncbi:MAG: alpha/beta-hydrolase family protein [Candidatus Nanopelagicales bacterium]|nr:alpha/beta-hydrolase family protein [Candidatus Nanopelagicales bacterium]